MAKKGLSLVIILALVLVAAVAAAFLLWPRRSVSTDSPVAYREYREGLEDAQRLYAADAMTHFRKALQADPNFVMAMVAVAQGELQLGDRDKARQILDSANARRDTVTRRERLALDLARAMCNRDMTTAHKVAETLKTDYHDDTAYQFLAEAKSGSPLEENRICREWLGVNPNAAFAYNLLGYSAAYKGNFPEAIANLKKYAFLAPDEANPFDSLGEVETACGKYDDAIADLHHALAIKPDFYFSRIHLADAQFGRGDLAEARQNYEKAYAVIPAANLKFDVLIKLFRIALRQKDDGAMRELVGRLGSLSSAASPFTSWAPLLQAARESVEGNYPAAMLELKAFNPGPLEKPGPHTAAGVASNVRYVKALVEFEAGHFEAAAALYGNDVPTIGKDTNLDTLAGKLRERALVARSLAHLGKFTQAQALVEGNERFNPNDFETRKAAALLQSLEKKAA